MYSTDAVSSAPECSHLQTVAATAKSYLADAAERVSEELHQIGIFTQSVKVFFFCHLNG